MKEELEGTQQGARKLLLLTLKESRNLNVIFQLTDRCVLSCRYCFAKGSHTKGSRLIERELLEKAIKSSFETRHAEVNFEWTGGEPFLAGLDFYKTVKKLQEQHASKPYHNTVQTSGYLNDQTLIAWLAEHHFHLSTTIDGDAEIHDFNRPAEGGVPSLERVLKTRESIVEKQGSCGSICTITQRSLGRESEILEFYRSLGVNSFHSNPYLFFSKNMVKDESIALSAEGYATYFINQFNAWFEQGKKIPVPGTLNYILKCLYNKTAATNTICTFGGRCLTSFVAITPNGDVYPCPKFTGFENMRLGSIKSLGIAEILSESNPVMLRLIDERLFAVNACTSENCDYLYLCNSGCPYYSFIASNGENIAEKEILCSGKKMLYSYLDTVVNALSSEALITDT